MTATLRLEHDRAAFVVMLRRIRAMRERAEDLTPAWDALLTWFSEQNFEQFLSRGSRYREPWAPLRPRTIAYKFRHGYPLDPLIRTGKMVQSLTHRPLGMERITPSSVAGGTLVSYTRFHMTGTRYMVARKPFSVTQIRKENAATSVIANYILRGDPKVTPGLRMRGGPG